LGSARALARRTTVILTERLAWMPLAWMPLALWQDSPPRRWCWGPIADAAWNLNFIPVRIAAALLSDRRIK
jgi:hypothetical protein